MLEKLLANRLLLTAVAYAALQFMLWLSMLYVTSRTGGRSTPPATWTRLAGYAALASTLTWLYVVLYAVGMLPYGPDTAVYTRMWHYIAVHGHWDARIARLANPYYSLLHTSAVTTFIAGSMCGSWSCGYTLYLTVLLVALLTLATLAARGRDYLQTLVLSSAVFLATPALLGEDALQQYVSMVLTFPAVYAASRLVQRGPREASIVFTVAAAAAIVTHLTPVLLLTLLLLGHVLEARTPRARLAVVQLAVTAYTLAMFYSVFTTAATTTLSSISTLLTRLAELVLRGMENRRVTLVRAYSEIPGATIWVFSWTLLPSLMAAYVSACILGRVTGSRLAGMLPQRLKGLLEGFGRVPCRAGLLAPTLLAIVATVSSIAARMAGVEALRYLLVPSMYTAYIISLYLLGPALSTRARTARLLLALLLAVGVYTGIQDPLRSPWNGGLRLAPVTIQDRVEMAPLAAHLDPSLLIVVYPWHDVYIPLELNEDARVVYGSVSYYTIHSVLYNVSRGVVPTEVQVGDLILYIPPRVIVEREAYRVFSLVYSGAEHIVLIEAIAGR